MCWHWVSQPCSCLRKRKKKTLSFILRKKNCYFLFFAIWGKSLQLWTAITSSALSDFEVLKLIKTEAKWIEKVDISGRLPVLPSISNKNVNSKRGFRRCGVVEILPQLKTKLLFSRWKKRGFDESIDKFRLSVVSLSDWQAYPTHFLYRLEFKTMPRSQSFQRAFSLRMCFFQVLIGLLDYLLQSISSVDYYISKC